MRPNASFRWAARWRDYPEALARIDALWRAWEHLRLDEATGSSTWWIEHADHHMPILMSRRAIRKVGRQEQRRRTIAVRDTAAGAVSGHEKELIRTVEHSTVGIVLTALSLLIMPALSLAERRTGVELGSAPAIVDPKQTLICAYLSAAVLIGLLLNTLVGWTWADPVAALVVSFAFKEGVEAWKGDSCTVPVSVLTGEREAEDDDHQKAAM